MEEILRWEETLRGFQTTPAMFETVFTEVPRVKTTPTTPTTFETVFLEVPRVKTTPTTFETVFMEVPRVKKMVNNMHGL